MKLSHLDPPALEDLRRDLETQLCEVRVELYRRAVQQHVDQQRVHDAAVRPLPLPPLSH